LPEYSFNLIAGDPGAGKTTLAQQIAFSRATAEEPALYFTVLGEPPLKMLRHLQQYAFFDHEKIGKAVHFVNLSDEATNKDLGSVLERILKEVETIHPALVVVDSFRTVSPSGEMHLQEFVQRLALHLTAWQATTFLVGEYARAESQTNPLFTVADGILWLTQNVERSACVRRLQVQKLRGCAPMAGLHTFVISSDGIRTLPRVLPRAEKPPTAANQGQRASTGVPPLDAMMGGGIPAGQSALFVGPSGTGKSVFARHFIAEGAKAGEPGVIVVFEEHPGEYLARSDAFGPKLKESIERGLVEVLYLRPLDLTVDEALGSVRDAVERTGARRLAIDSLSGFELALSPSHRDDFRESLFRLVNALTGLGVTVLMTVDLVQSLTEFGLSPHITEFLADVIVLMRYVELGGHLQKLLAVVKMRNSRHDTAVHRYAIDDSGVVLGEAMLHYRGVLMGAPAIAVEDARSPAGLTEEEARLLEQVRELGEGSARELTRRTGMKARLLSRGLERLLALGYLTKGRRGGATVYRTRVTGP
jgi:circadian clock protein KaiC